MGRPRGRGTTVLSIWEKLCRQLHKEDSPEEEKHNHTEACLPLLSMSGDSEVLQDTVLVLGVGQVIGRSLWVKLFFCFVLFVFFLRQ